MEEKIVDISVPKRLRDDARSRRKKNHESRGNGHSASTSNGNLLSNGGESRGTRRDERVTIRRKRIAMSRARRHRRGCVYVLFGLASLSFCLALVIFCVVLFRPAPDGKFPGKSAIKAFGDKIEKEANRVRKHRLKPGSYEGRSTPISAGKWPVSIRDEDGNFEEIQHPGHDDGRVVMSVPKFWINDPVAIHENKLMSFERAMSIGTCISPDSETGSHARGNECPLNERTIFVAIASYRDWQCRDTVTSIFSAASYPERIRVAVVDQIVLGEDGQCDIPHQPCSEDPEQPICKYKGQLDVFQMDAELAVGPVFARHLGHRLYRGEYYAMQSDAHVTFVRGWDTDIIGQIEATGDEMAVLSTYLTDIVGSIDPNTGLSLRKTRPIMCNTEYEGGVQGKHLRHLAQPECAPEIHGMPQLQPYWAAGFSFSRGHFVATTPYDLYQPMIFQGEEMSITLRGFTIGYDFFAPEKSVCFHSYAKGENEEARNKVPHFWEHADLYKGVGIKAMKRLLGIVKMNPEVDPSEWNHAEEAKYGIGGARTVSKFYETFGVDVVRKQTQRHLCQFVRNRMHHLFMPYLRSDSMGIDYDNISFEWVDPRPNEE